MYFNGAVLGFVFSSKVNAVILCNGVRVVFAISNASLVLGIFVPFLPTKPKRATRNFEGQGVSRHWGVVFRR